MLGESSKVALISTSFVLIEALCVDISRVQLGSISVKSNVCAVPFNKHDPIGSCSSREFKRATRKSILILAQSFIFII